MMGDVLLISEGHRRAAKQIAKKIFKFKLDKFLIAIGGESGSGKSEVAHLVSRSLKGEGNYCKILHTDNYYRIPPNKRTEWRESHGIESISFKEYNWDLINKNIEDFKESKESTLPCIDLLTDQRDKLITDFDGINVLILEGLYSLKAEADLKVFIDLTYHDTKKSQILRGKEPKSEYRLRVLEREHVLVQSLKELADFIINKDFTVIEVKK